MDELPIIPIFYFNFNYLKKECLQNPQLIATGYLDLNDASIASNQLVGDDVTGDTNDEDIEYHDDNESGIDQNKDFTNTNVPPQ
jgi:hypothetical protein